MELMPKEQETNLNIKICQIVENFPALYDAHHLDYTITSVQEKIWKGIAEQLDVNPTELKDKWRNIRDTYVRIERLKSKNKRKSDYYLTPYLKFLDNHFQIKIKLTESKPIDEKVEGGVQSANEESNSNDVEDQESEDAETDSLVEDDNEESSQTEAERDLLFLKSLLPHMKVMTSTQKRNFKIAALTLAGEVLEDEAGPSSSCKKLAK